MHRSGIVVSNELVKAVHDAGQDGTGYLHVRLVDESFQIVGRGGSTGSLDTDFEAVAKILQKDQASYVLLRHGDKWILIFFVPESAQVKDKMVYASSRGALKDGLGSNSFTDDFFISHIEECTLEGYEHANDKGPRHELMTRDELSKLEAHQDSLKAVTAAKSVALAVMPVESSDSAKDAIEQFKAGSAQAVIFTLGANESIVGKTESKVSTNALAGKLSDKEPAYVVFHYSHRNEGVPADADIFIYYCPDAAPPRNKMTYSSCKSSVLAMLEGSGVTVARNLEISEPKELTDDFLLDELYPKAAAAKKNISKPKPAAGRKAPSKFQANA